MPTPQWYFRCPAPLRSAVEAKAERLGLDASLVIRGLLLEWLGDEAPADITAAPAPRTVVVAPLPDHARIPGARTGGERAPALVDVPAPAALAPAPDVVAVDLGTSSTPADLAAWLTERGIVSRGLAEDELAALVAKHRPLGPVTVPTGDLWRYNGGGWAVWIPARGNRKRAIGRLLVATRGRTGPTRVTYDLDGTTHEADLTGTTAKIEKLEA